MAESWEIYRNDPATGLPNETGLAEWITDGALTITPEYRVPGESLMDGALYGVDYTIGGSSVMAWGVTRHGLGQIDAKTETVDGAAVNYAYTYTAAGQLDTVTKGGVLVEDYAYDAQGRRTSDIDGRVYAYDDEDHLTSVDGARTTWYAYDLDGFLTQKDVDTDGDLVVDETTVYEYGARGELISVLLPDGTLIEYINGPSGQRLAKRVKGVTVEKYLWGGLTNLLAVLDPSGNVLQRYEYAGGRLPVAMVDGTDTWYLHYDQVGSLRAITDAAGNVVREIVYDSFGNLQSSTGTGPEVPIAFAGGLYDADTGLTRFGYRDYDPEVGRWTAKDPIGFAGGSLNIYAYCGDDPVNWSAPVGLRALTSSERAVVQCAIDAIDRHYSNDWAQELQSMLDNGNIKTELMDGISWLPFLFPRANGKTRFFDHKSIFLNSDLFSSFSGSPNDYSNIKSLSVLASVLAHELSHVRAYQEFPVGDGIVGRAAKRLTDRIPMPWKYNGRRYNQGEHLATMIEDDVARKLNKALEKEFWQCMQR